MTDPFEDAVRAAGRGLASPEPAPTYHGAWKRGRRRRLAKRSAVAVAGVLALVVAFSVDLGRFQGGGTTIDVDDIAAESDVVPAPTTATSPSFEPTSAPVATTEPVLGEPDPSPEAASAGLATAPDLELDPELSDVADGTANPTGDADEPAQAATEPTAIPPTAIPTAIATPTLAPEPTPIPTVAPTVVPPPTPSIDTTLDPDPSPTAEASTFADPEGQDDPAGDAQTTPAGEAPGQVDTLPPADPQTSTRLGLPADARIAPGATTDGTELKCDVDSDGIAEALCELLPMYRCANADEIRAGYQGLDLDSDGAVDTCVALAQTTCDTTGDGIGDASCLIRNATPEEIPDN